MEDREFHGWRDAAPVSPPPTISAAAQAILAMPPMPALAFPDVSDAEGWRSHVAAVDARVIELVRQPLAAAFPVDRRSIAGVPVYDTAPDGVDPASGRIFLDMHGGALVYLGGEAIASSAQAMALRVHARVVSIDYRMPPDHPYPAGLDDCVAVYRALADQYGAANIVVGGSSAGGNLAAALLLRARDERLDLPAGLVLLTPEVDLTESGDTFRTLLGLDRLRPLMPVNRLYAAGTPLDDPYVSPLFGDLTGFPPTFLQAGTRDLFLSNTVRMHRALRKAGVPAELHVWEAMPHGGFGGTPEDEEIAIELRGFVAARWGRG